MWSNRYHVQTCWRIAATVREVYEILNDPSGYQRWWPEVFLSIRVTERDVLGKPRSLAIHSKGWLPYALRWQARAVDNGANQRFALQADGDFAGYGTFALKQEGSWVSITFDWRVAARKPLLRWTSWLLKPLYAANHRWAMRRGERALQQELQRRRTALATVTWHPRQSLTTSRVELLPA
jgi:hypothetical protein